MSESTGDIEFSATIGAIAKALASAQGEIQDAKKDAVNPHFKNKYSTLAAVRAAITPAFSKYGLAVAQPFEPHGPDHVCVVTLLMHESGEWIKSRLVMPLTKKDAQGMGSAISYARRYALAAIANVASDEDDDGNAAMAKPESVKTAPAPAAIASVDVDALVKALEVAKDAKALAEASVAVGRVKDKLTKDDTMRLRAAHDNRLRELEAAA